jgi:hypothetical protein
LTFTRINFVLGIATSFNEPYFKASGSGGSRVNFTISHRDGRSVASHMIQRARMGDNTCDLLSLAELGLNQDVPSASLLATCLLSNAQTPGYYNMSVIMRDGDTQGVAWANPSDTKYADVLGLFRESISHEVFQFQVVPEIASLSLAAGGMGGGQRLTIRGSSFGNSTSEMTVDIDGRRCSPIISRTHDTIVCETAPSSLASEAEGMPADTHETRTASCMLPTMATDANSNSDGPEAPLPFGQSSAKSTHNSTYEYVSYDAMEWVHYSAAQAFDGRSFYRPRHRSWRSVLEPSPPLGGRNHSVNSTWLQYDFPALFKVTKYAIQPYHLFPCNVIQPDRDPTNWTLWGRRANGSWTKADERHSVLFTTEGCWRNDYSVFDVRQAPSALFSAVRLEVTAVRGGDAVTSHTESTELDNLYFFSPQACDPLRRSHPHHVFRGGRGLMRTSFRSSTVPECSGLAAFASSLQSTSLIDDVPREQSTGCAQDVLYAAPGESKVLIENVDGCQRNAGNCEQSTHGQLDVINVYEGVFKPKRTGNHTFYMASFNGAASLFLSEVGLDPNTSALLLSVSQWQAGWGSSRKYLSVESDPHPPVHLVGGKHYYLRVHNKIDHNDGGFLSLAVRAPGNSSCNGGCCTSSTLEQQKRASVGALSDPSWCAEFYAPIPGDMLLTLHAKPQVHVNVNGIEARCVGECSFRTLEQLTPVLSSVVETVAADKTKTVSLTLAGAGFEAAVESEEPSTNVWLGTREHGNYCTITSLSPEAIVCSLLNNTVAGLNLPIVVHVAGKGAAVHRNGSFSSEDDAQKFVHRYSVLSRAESLLPRSGSLGGGTKVTITGHNFGTQRSVLRIYMYQAMLNVSLECDVMSVEPTALMFRTPSLATPFRNYSSLQFEVRIGPNNDVGERAPSVGMVELKFNYAADATPVISLITPDVGVPTEINKVTIHGEGFGSDPSMLEVRVGQDLCAVTRTVLSAGTQKIHCLVTGQPPGEHNVQVLVQPQGYAVGIVSFFSVFQIDSFSPTRGSMAGGTVVTIVGAGFASEAGRNLVVIGHGECDVQSASPTMLVCVTRREHSRFVAEAYLDEPAEAVLEISVSVRNLQAECMVEGGCWFEFIQSQTPQMVSAAFSGENNQNIRIMGSGFSAAGNKTQNTIFLVHETELDLYHECPVVRVESRGARVGNSASFWIKGKRVPMYPGRGLNFLVLSVAGGVVTPTSTVRFDWNAGPAFLAWAQGLPPGTLVLGCALDYANVRQTEEDVAALRLLGANQLDPAGFHRRYGGWAMIGEAGGNGTALQSATDPFGVADLEATLPCSPILLEKHPPRAHQLTKMSRCFPVINVSSDGTELECRAPELPAGTATVYMQAQPGGIAQGAAKVRYNLSFNAITPSAGSRGGTIVTVTGRGFHPSMAIHLQNSNWAHSAGKGNLWWTAKDNHWRYEQIDPRTGLVVEPLTIRRASASEGFITLSCTGQQPVGNATGISNAASSTSAECRTSEADVEFHNASVLLTLRLGGRYHHVNTTNQTLPPMLEGNNTFSALDSSTPIVVLVTPRKQSRWGNTLVTLTGERFSATVSDNVVTVGGRPTTVISANQTRIVFRVVKWVPAGEHDIELHVAGHGYALWGQRALPNAPVSTCRSRTAAQCCNYRSQYFGTYCVLTIPTAASGTFARVCTSRYEMGYYAEYPGRFAQDTNLVVKESCRSNQLLTFESDLWIDSVSPTQGSVVGGQILTIQGTGFDMVTKERNVISVCGVACEVLGVAEDEASATQQLKCKMAAISIAPQLNAPLASFAVAQSAQDSAFSSGSSTYGQEEKIWPASSAHAFAFEGTYDMRWFDGIPESDGNGNSDRVSANWQTCSFRMNASSELMQISRLRFVPSTNWEARRDHQPEGVQVWASENGEDGSWVLLFALKESAVGGWNELEAPDAFSERLFRHLMLNTSNPDSTECWFAELELYGRVFSDSATGVCPVTMQLAPDGPTASVDGPTASVDEPIQSLGYRKVPLRSTTSGYEPEVSYTTHADAALEVSYTAASTPIVTEVSPSSGTTAGGTLLAITGSGLSAATEGQVGGVATVRLDGVECNVTYSSDALIHCITGPRPTHRPLEMLVTVAGKGTAALQPVGGESIAFLYRDRWSAASTWGGLPPPPVNFSSVIPVGQTILLDVSPPQQILIVIEGVLEFEDNDDKELQATYIFIRGGRLIVGREHAPFTHTAVITLHGKPYVTPELPIYGGKTIAVRRGGIDLHGTPVVPAWTQLGATAEVGEAILVLTESVNWRVGQAVVVASSNFSMHEAEQLTITSVSDDNRTIGVAPPLQYMHFGRMLEYQGWEVDLRAEVAVLDRNVKVQGDPSSADTRWGATMMLHSPGGNDSTVGRFSNVECAQCGQAFNLGRYPIHMHMIGAVHQSYVRNCSIHHAFNRAVTIHGVHWFKLEHTVAFDVLGHTFFMEDGVETKNTLHHNLGLVTRKADSLLNSDATPATFWITNPDNFITDNAAAGSDRYGFWFDLPVHPGGASATSFVCPQGLPLGQFERNRAHSNGRYGLRIFNSLVPRTQPCYPFADFMQVSSQANLPVLDHASNSPVPAIFRDFVTYKNGRNGVIGSNIGAVVFDRVIAADNAHAGIEVETIEAPAGAAKTTNSLLIGHSELQGSDPIVPANVFSELYVVALVAPRKDNYSVHNCTIINYDRVGMSAFSHCPHCTFLTTQDQDARTTSFTSMRYVNVTSFADWTFPKKVIFHSPDGTLVPGSEAAGAAQSVTPYKPFLHMPGVCAPTDQWANGLLCKPTVRLLRLSLSMASPLLLEGATLIVRPKKRRSAFQQEANKALLPTSDGSVEVVVAVGVAADHGSGDYAVCMLRRGEDGLHDSDYHFQGFNMARSTMSTGNVLKDASAQQHGQFVQGVSPAIFRASVAVNLTLYGLHNAARRLENGDVVKFVPIWATACQGASTPSAPGGKLWGVNPQVGPSQASVADCQGDECETGAPSTADVGKSFWASGGVSGANKAMITLAAGALNPELATHVGFERVSDPNNGWVTVVATKQHLHLHFQAEVAAGSGQGLGNPSSTTGTMQKLSVDFESLAIDLQNSAPRDWLLLTFNHTEYRDHYEVSSLRPLVAENIQGIQTGEELMSKYEGTCTGCTPPPVANGSLLALPHALLRPPQPLVDSHGAYYYNRTAKTVTLLLQHDDRTDEHEDDQSSRATHPLGPLSLLPKVCPEEGCNPDFREGAWREQFQREWSNGTQWPDQEGRDINVPAAGEDATVLWEWTMILDVDTAVLRFLYVEGALVFDRRRESTSLRASSILIYPGALVKAGSVGSAYMGKATIELHGSRLSPMLPLAELDVMALGTQGVSIGPKALVVLGELSLYGTPRSRPWSRLLQPVSAGTSDGSGSTLLHVEGRVDDWLPGEDIVVTSTSHDAGEMEVRRIVSVSTSTVEVSTSTVDGFRFRSIVRVDSPFNHTHHGANPVSPGQHSPELRAEVGLLSRNVAIKGIDASMGDVVDAFGAHVRVGMIPSLVSSDGAHIGGAAALSWVSLERCGQSRTERPSLLIGRGAHFAKSSLTAVVVRGSMNTAVAIPACSSAMHVSGCLVFDTLDGSSFDVGSSGGDTSTANFWADACVLEFNLAAGVRVSGYQHYANEFGVQSLHANYREESGRVILRSNVAAGSYNYGFILKADPCAVWDTQSIHDDAGTRGRNKMNLAHSNRVGAFFLTGGWCTAMGHLQVHKSFDSGVVFYKHASRVRLANISAIDCSIGLVLAPVTSSTWSRVYLTDILIVGASAAAGCGYSGNTAQCTQEWEATAEGVASWLQSGARQKAGCGGGAGASRKWDGPRGSANEQQASVSSGRVGLLAVIPNSKASPTFKYFPPIPPYMPWQNIRGAATFGGLVVIERVTFQNFSAHDGCGRVNHAFSTNNWSPSAHPLHKFVNISWIDVDQAAKFWFDDPLPAWRAHDDCGGMDCTGLYNVVLWDSDGTLLGGGNGATTLISSPPASGNPGGNISHPTECTRRLNWNSYECTPSHTAGRYDLLYLESTDGDAASRRVHPLFVESNDSGENGWKYLNVLNAYRDEGWNGAYTSGIRPARFPVSIRLGQHYDIRFSSTNPRDLRVALSSAGWDEGVVLTVRYQSPEQIEIRRASTMSFVPPLAENYHDELVRLPTNRSAFARDAIHGSSVWVNLERKLSFVVRGTEPLLLRTLNSVKVSLKLASSVEDFYDSGGTEAFVTKLAFSLGIPWSRIRVVSVVAGRRRRLSWGEGLPTFEDRPEGAQATGRKEEGRLLTVADNSTGDSSGGLAIDFVIVEDTSYIEQESNSSSASNSGNSSNSTLGTAANNSSFEEGGVAVGMQEMILELGTIADRLQEGLASQEGNATDGWSLGLGEVLGLEAELDIPPATPCDPVCASYVADVNCSYFGECQCSPGYFWDPLFNETAVTVGEGEVVVTSGECMLECNPVCLGGAQCISTPSSATCSCSHLNAALLGSSAISTGDTAPYFYHETAGCSTPAPTASPTTSPSSQPTDAPTPAPTVATCNNGETDGQETDVDCGGAECNGCGIGQVCTMHSDCAAGHVCGEVSLRCEATSAPTAAPTVSPTAVPTSTPTAAPTTAPTATPTTAPTAAPTSAPSPAPSASPSASPSLLVCQHYEFKNSSGCFACDHSCSTCSDGGAGSCLSCDSSAGEFLHAGDETSHTICVAEGDSVVSASMQLRGEEASLFSQAKRSAFAWTVAEYMGVEIQDVTIARAIDGTATTRTARAMQTTARALSIAMVCMVEFRVRIEEARAVEMSLHLHAVVTSGEFVGKLKQNAAATGVTMMVQSIAIGVPPIVETSDPTARFEFIDMVAARDAQESGELVDVDASRRDVGGLIMLVLAILMACGLGSLVLRKWLAHRNKHPRVIAVNEVVEIKLTPSQSTSFGGGEAGPIYAACFKPEEETKDERAAQEEQRGKRRVAKAPEFLPPASSLPNLQPEDTNPLAPAPAHERR